MIIAGKPLLEDEVIEFISLIRNSCPELQTKIFTEGACFQFYLILRNRFPQARAYYDMNHVVTKIDDKFYDITGEVSGHNHYIMVHFPQEWGLKYTP